jgi:hypothetical protein
LVFAQCAASDSVDSFVADVVKRFNEKGVCREGECFIGRALDEFESSLKNVFDA